MKIVFCSNYMNHHQLYISLAMINLGIDYKFIATTEVSSERKSLGYRDINSEYNWIVRMYENSAQRNIAKQLIKDADLVIAGSFPMKYIRNRVLHNKPVFLYSERWFKSTDGDTTRFRTFHNFLSNLIHRKYLNCFNVHMLCASAYTALDCSIYGNFKNKCYKWGYFPCVVQYDIDKLLDKKNKNDIIELLWVGRLLDWKHPEYPIELAKRLKEKGIEFNLNMIGIGKEYDNILNTVNKLNLGSCVHLLGGMPTEKVREYMEKANIFLFTSDFNEGWGVVLNEAMNSACAVVACNGIGSVPFLIDNGKNGLTFNYGDIEGFVNSVISLINDKNLANNLGRQAYNTIVTEWNPTNAAKKLIRLYNYLFKKSCEPIESGVCSKAEIMDNFWRKN